MNNLKIQSAKDFNFAVFILSHGRANKVDTYKTLKRQNYTGKIYIICDDTDTQIEEYNKNFGSENVIVFDKLEAYKKTPIERRDGNMKAVVFARNKVWDIAKDLGIDYFLVLDDDYSKFEFTHDNRLNYARHKKVRNLDLAFGIYLKYFSNINAKTLCMAQGGDFMGGPNSGLAKCGIYRKAMNSFFCATNRPFKFYGTINEDTTAYCYLGSQGELLLTANQIMLRQRPTQSNAGGLTNIYLDKGTYYKSLLTAVWCPSFVKVSRMGFTKRWHHRVSWANAVPKILDEEYRK